MTKDNNKSLTIAEQFKEQLNTPKTYEQFVLEEQQEVLTEQQFDELVAESYETEWDSHHSISRPRKGGPMLDRDIIQEGRKIRKKEEEEKRSKNLCIKDYCESSAKIGSYCEFHRRKIGEETWWLKMSVDTAASAFVPGYDTAKTVVGAASWVAGQASGSQSARDFGGNIIKDEINSEALQLTGAVRACSLGIHPHIGLEVGGYVSTGIGIIKSTTEWINHQKHWETYRSDCPVCSS